MVIRVVGPFPSNRHMKLSYVGAIALGAAIMAAFLAYPAFATTGSTSTASQGAGGPPPQGPRHGFGPFGGFGAFGHALGFGQQSAPSFTTGQAITVTSTSGKYSVVGTQGKTNGTASGTVTITVEGKLTAGYTVSLGGSITVAGTTYTLTSGSGVMGPGGANVQGEGTTSSSGTFILRASANGNFSGTTTSSVSIDFSNGTTEYVVLLTGTIQA